jgi:hypothetical protein
MCSQLIEDDKSGFRSTHAILKKYFSKDSLLSSELELFKVIKESRGLKREEALKVISEVMLAVKSLDRKTIDIKKSNLIKEINYNFGKDFFSKYRLHDYRTLATIQLLVDACSSEGKLSENIQRVKLEEALINYMVTSNNEQAVECDREIDNLVLSIASKNFNEKYGNSLSKNQKIILENYTRAIVTDDFSSIRKIICDSRDRILGIIERSFLMKEIREDSVMKERMVEAKNILINLDTLKINDSVVQEILLYQKLCEELISNE